MAKRGPSHIDRHSQDGGPETAASTARGDDGAGSAGSASSAAGSDEEISLPGCNAPALPNAHNSPECVELDFSHLGVKRASIFVAYPLKGR